MSESARRVDYARIRQLEQDIYGEWFTVDELPSAEDVERLRPYRLARAYEVAEQSAALLREARP